MSFLSFTFSPQGNGGMVTETDGHGIKRPRWNWTEFSAFDGHHRVPCRWWQPDTCYQHGLYDLDHSRAIKKLERLAKAGRFNPALYA